MALFVLGASMVADGAKDPGCVADVLWRFVQDNDHLIVVDSAGVVLNEYRRIAEESDQVACWLNMLLLKKEFLRSSSVEIAGELREKAFLKLAAKTNNCKKLIVYGHDCWAGDMEYLDGGCILHDGELVKVYERSEAKEALRPVGATIQAFNSTVATHGSTIGEGKPDR